MVSFFIIATNLDIIPDLQASRDKKDDENFVAKSLVTAVILAVTAKFRAKRLALSLQS